MKFIIFLLGFGFAALLAFDHVVSLAPAVQTNPSLPRCESDDAVRRDSFERLELSQRRIVEQVRRDDADPVTDAAAAAERGDWGLIYGHSMNGSAPFGVRCVGSGREYPGPLAAAYRMFSDLPVSCETRGADGDCTVDQRLDRYAPAYNLALISHPLYPYRDFCAPASGPSPEHDRWDAPPDSLDLVSPIADATTSRTAGEAARRGDVSALQAFARRDPASILAVDAFGWTPLAWAVGHRQDAAARWLVTQGAVPDGGECRRLQSPFELALRTGQDDLAFLLHDATPAPRRQSQWRRRMLELAALGGASRFFARMLEEPNDGLDQLSPPHGRYFHPSVERLIAREQASLCWRGHPPPASAVHLIAVYDGKKRPSERHPNPNPGEIEILVTAGPQPKFLVLSAYDGTDWRVRLEPGARLSGVVALGYDDQRVSGVPAGVTVVRNRYGHSCATGPRSWRWGAHGLEDMGELQQTVARLIGAEAEHVQAVYEGDRFTI